MRAFLVPALLLALGCDAAPTIAPDEAGADASIADATDGSAVATDASADADAGDALAKLGALTASCNQVSNGLFALNGGDTPTVPICGLTGAVFWKADMDVDCDGKITTECNSTTDPYFQNQTAATDSQGNPLDAAHLPYVVVPGKSTKFDYVAAGLHMGSVVVVLYNDKIEYAVLGDVGPSGDIGEASYATVNDLGANPDPKVGGVDGPDVLYVAFTGSSEIVSPIEDHTQAISVGQAALAKLVGP